MTGIESDTSSPKGRWRLVTLPHNPTPAMPANGTPWWARLRAIVGIPIIVVFFAIVAAGLVAATAFGMFLLAQQVFLS